MGERHKGNTISATRARFDAIRAARARDPGGDDEALFAQLSDVFAELATAEEDLRTQGDHLAAARGALEGRFHRYQDLFEFMPDGYLVTDEAGLIREANKAAVALLATTRQAVVGRSIASFAAALDRGRVRRQLAIAKREPGDHHEEVELTLQPRGRPSVPVALTVAAIRDDDGRPFGFRLLLRDISAHRKIEQAAQVASAAVAANQAKDEFLAMLSHELRNPLHAIIGWSGILLTETLPSDQQQRALETIDRNAHQLNRLVGDLLDVSRIAQRKLLFQPRACDLTTVVAGAFDAVRSELVTRQHRFTAKVHDPGLVVADPARLQQIVANLLGNAVKFTPPGGTIELRLDAHEGEIEIVVRDDGSGIDADLLAHVFERFRQGDTAPTERGGGLGLGLPIARTLARMHGGDLWADSPGGGGGATFTVRLPLRLHPKEARIDTPPPQVESPPHNRQLLIGMHALVVCSDNDTAEEVAHHLVLAGATTTTAPTPAHAPVHDAVWKADALIVVVPRADRGLRLLTEATALVNQIGAPLPVLAIAPSSAIARRWLTLPAEVALCMRGEVEPAILPARVAFLAQISGWAPAG